MKLSLIFGFLFVGLAYGAPTTKEDKLVINNDFFPDSLKIYESQHDIVKIYVPINKLNFDETEGDDDSNSVDILFFVEADVSGDETVDQGLYIKKGNNVKKLLDHGRDVIAPTEENSKLAFFAAKDGIYVYNSEENKAEKYGTVDDDLIGIEIESPSKIIYVLSADKKVYKVSEDGNKKEQLDEIKNAEQIVLDSAGNLYYVDSEKKLYIVNADGVRQVEGLPENFSKITLARPPFVFDEGGIPLVVDRKTYTLHANRTLEEEDIVIDTEITAFSLEATILQYYAHEKKIYEYNLLALILGNLLEQLKAFMDDMKIDIQNISTKSRSEFTAKA